MKFLHDNTLISIVYTSDKFIVDHIKKFFETHKKILIANLSFKSFLIYKQLAYIETQLKLQDVLLQNASYNNVYNSTSIMFYFFL